MLNASVPGLDTIAGRMIGGMLILSADHPIAMALILAAVIGASGAVLFDLLGERAAATEAERPIRPWRR